MSASKNLIVPIILAGGKGTRLWPMSRASRPKQFLALVDDRSLFQQTLERVSDSKLYAAPIVITNQEYRFLVAEQALECGIQLNAILLEPIARNTAAAITAASIVADSKHKNQLVLILPSDHNITIDEAYFNSLEVAKNSAADGRLVTFGITPTEPASGYGYVKIGNVEKSGAYTVDKFHEKPSKSRAKELVDSGEYYWNSGMFLFSASTFLNECKLLAPDVYSAAGAAVKHAKNDLDFLRLDENAFATSPDISVDYAVFEKTKLASIVPSPIIWSDLGAWDTVWKASERDANDNLQRGPTTLSNTTGSLVITEKHHVAVDGLDGITVIASEDAIYVGRLSQAQVVGEIVKNLKSNPETRALTEDHLTSYRPWGGYSSVLVRERFQVKRLFIRPQKRLSLQKHHHRSEHWIVVRGTAEVQIDDNITILRENESVYIPQGAIHRLHNPGKILLELIEVQTGSYLGEDDIIRIEDEFGRT